MCGPGVFNKFTRVMNNKHIENGRADSYNGTYKRRHLLINESQTEGGGYVNDNGLKRMLLSFALPAGHPETTVCHDASFWISGREHDYRIPQRKGVYGR